MSFVWQKRASRLSSSAKARFNSRIAERKLLYLVGLYTATGMLGLFFTLPGDTGRIALLSGLFAVAGFFLVHIYWSFTGYRGDCFLLPLTAALTATGLVFLFRIDPFYGTRQFIWLLAALVVLVLTTSLLKNIRFLDDYKYIYAVLGLVALILPIFFG